MSELPLSSGSVNASFQQSALSKCLDLVWRAKKGGSEKEMVMQGDGKI